MTTADDIRAAMTPVVQAALLDAFKLGVGHAIRSIEGRRTADQYVAVAYRSNLLSAYAVIAGLQNQVEDDERNMRAARRQIELFMADGKRERLTVALALLDASVEARNEAWFDFTEQRGQ